jgi:trigger factor
LIFTEIALIIFYNMNIKQENLDELNSVITVQIEPEDYESKVDEVLRDYRRKAKFNGFRPGKAPMGIVRKLYGTSAVIDQVNQLLSDGLNKHLIENELRILGEPLPSKDSPSIDWSNQKSFDFVFDIALAPEFEISISGRDKVPFYLIQSDDKIIDEQIENFSQRFGSYEPSEEAGENDLLKGDFIQLDENGDPLENGIRTEDTLVSLGQVADEENKKQLTGVKANQDVVIDPVTAFPNEADRAAMFRVKREELGRITGKFRYTVSEVSSFKPAEINQELFDKTYGEGTVSSIEEYREKIRNDLEMQFRNESNYKFHIDAREKLLKKADFNLPDEFLKRWMLETTKDETLTNEKIEEEYPSFRDDLRWQLIKDKIIEEQSISVEENEKRAYAVEDARNRFRQYGMYDVPQEQLAGLAESILSNKDEERRLVEQIQENKVINFVKETVKVDEKKVSLDEFKKLFD